MITTIFFTCLMASAMTQKTEKMRKVEIKVVDGSRPLTEEQREQIVALLKADDEKRKRMRDKAVSRIKIPDAYFSPGIAAVIEKLILEKPRKIRASLYRFTLYNLAQAWVTQKKKWEGKDTHGMLIVDKDYGTDFLEALALLQGEKVPLYTLKGRNMDTYLHAYENMHHKFILLEDGEEKILIHGSFNATGSAEELNWEDITILNDPGIVTKFLARWKEMYYYREWVPKISKKSYTGQPKSGPAFKRNKIPLSPRITPQKK